MADKVLNTRIQMKHDTEENWLKATNFIPKPGEVIVYDEDSSNTFPRCKVGDGVTTVTNLPFIFEPVTVDDLAEICGSLVLPAAEAVMW